MCRMEQRVGYSYKLNGIADVHQFIIPDKRDRAAKAAYAARFAGLTTSVIRSASCNALITEKR